MLLFSSSFQIIIRWFSQVYNGNSDRNGIVINDLETPIEARVIRINPVEWHGHIAMRMELYGCRLPSGNLNVFLFYAMFRRRRRFSLECRKYSNFHLLWFGHITLHEWLKILAQLCRPVSSKTKTNCGSLTNLSLSLVSATCICLEFWLLHWIVCVPQLKTALFNAGYWENE